MKYILLDENNVVIQVDESMSEDNFIEGYIFVEDNVYCGMIKQPDGKYTIPNEESQ